MRFSKDLRVVAEYLGGGVAIAPAAQPATRSRLLPSEVRAADGAAHLQAAAARGVLNEGVVFLPYLRWNPSFNGVW